jgi:glycosyltransferase involved in cell wall biosynthesis
VRIAWVTPLGVESAIAEYSVELTGALASSCEVEIWASDHPPWRETPLAVSMLRDSEARHELASVDARVYNMGDHSSFHRAVYDASVEYPGYCVLHDRVYQGLFASMWLGTRAGNERYRHAMVRHYGSKGGRAADDSLRGVRPPVWESAEDSFRFPLDDELIGRARGVIVHSDGHRRAIETKWLGPVGRVHFPVYRTPPKPSGQPRAPDDRVTLLTIGRLNPNKQIHRVIDAIGRNDELRRRVQFIVVGPENPTYLRELERLVETHDLEATVRLMPGFRARSDLDHLCLEADVFVNLREPALEGASASLMEQLAHGTPVITSETGFRAELPRGCVISVPEGDDGALSRALQQVATDPGLRARVGSEGLRYAAGQTVERASAEYRRFFEEAPSWGPMLDLADRTGTELYEMGMTTASASVAGIAREIAAIGLP